MWPLVCSLLNGWFLTDIFDLKTANVSNIRFYVCSQEECADDNKKGRDIEGFLYLVRLDHQHGPWWWFSTSYVLLLYRCFLVQSFRRAQTEDFSGIIIILRNIEAILTHVYTLIRLSNSIMNYYLTITITKPSGQCFQTLRHFTDHSGKWIEFVVKIPSQTLGRMIRLYSGLFFPEIPRDSWSDFHTSTLKMKLCIFAMNRSDISTG